MRKLKLLVIYALTFVLTFIITVTPASAAKKTYIAPTATNVSVSGTPAIGKTLTGNYTYYDASGIPQGASTYKWLYSSSLSGTYYAISGATAKTYTVTSKDAGYYIKFQVTPVAARGYPDTGLPVQSAAVGPVAVPVLGSVPEASNVNISGNAAVGQVLTGNYAYYDKDGDLEGNSTYRWLSSTAMTGTYTAISGGTSRTYTPASTDAGKYIKFEVTPLSVTGTPNTGIPVQSALVGPVPIPTVSRVVMGFAVKSYATDVLSYNSLVNNTKSIDQIATVSYTTDSFGTLSGAAPADQVSYAINNGIKPLVLVSNSDSSGFNSSIAQSILEHPAYSQALIDNLVKVIEANGYKGVNVDLENIPYTDRANYSQLIADIKNTLSPLGYLTTISIPAKTADSLTNSWSGAFDYAALGTTADEILLMSYDEHGTWTTPGSVASIGWVTNVVAYAKKVIPANKILIGLAAYGYDWSSAGNKALSLNKIDSLIATFGGTVQWDTVSESPYYIYTDTSGIKHTIWFENYSSISYKCDLVNQNDLLGVGIWRLGLEDPAYWNTINTEFGK